MAKVGTRPTHSQTLQSWFAQIPGLKVIMPAFPKEGYNLLRSSIADPNPVIFIEHRWLHQMSWNGEGRVVSPTQLGKSNRVSTGSDITIVSNSIVLLFTSRSKHIKKYNVGIE